MIVFDLHCKDGHRFEGWFASAKDFSSQKRRGLLSCPTCGGADIKRALSAPRLNMGAEAPKQLPVPAQKTPEMEGKDPFAIAQMLYSRMLDEVLTKTEDTQSICFPSKLLTQILHPHSLCHAACIERAGSGGIAGYA